MSREVHSKLVRVKNGLVHYGEVRLFVEENMDGPTVLEAYKGQGWTRQGEVEAIPSNGYDLWKEGIREGLQYGLDRLEERHIKVTVLEACGMTTDTSTTILALVAARALLENFANTETEEEKQLFEKLAYASFDYEDACPDLKTFVINGRKRDKSPYKAHRS